MNEDDRTKLIFVAGVKSGLTASVGAVDSVLEELANSAQPETLMTLIALRTSLKSGIAECAKTTKDIPHAAEILALVE